MSYENTISDYPFKLILSDFWNTVFAQNWYKGVIIEVTKATNANHGILADYVSLDQTTLVINAYVNLMNKYTEEQYPEFNSYLTKKGNNAQWNMIKTVSQVSGVSVNQVRDILDNLEWASKDGRIKTNAIWHPRTFKKTAGMNNPDEDFKERINPTDPNQSQFSKLFSFLTNNIITVLLVGGGIYVAAKTGIMQKGFSKIKEEVQKK